MAQRINYVVAKTSPNLYAAAKQANLPASEITQLEQFSWTIDKNKNLMKLSTDQARKEFAALDPDAQEKIKYLYPNADYVQPPEDMGDRFVGVLKGGAKLAASPLIGLFKAAGVWSRVINTPYLMARQAAQGEGLFTKETFTDAWDGRRIYDHGALADAIEYFGDARVKVAQGLIAGKKPGEILEAGGEVTQDMLDALQEAYNEPEKFRQVMDATKYAQVSLGRDVARMLDTKPVGKGGLQGDYIDGKTKNISGFIDFAYQLVIDPLTYVSGGLTKLPVIGSKFTKQGDALLENISKYGAAGVKQVFRDNPDVVKLWDQQIGKDVQRLIDAEGTAAKTAIRREIGQKYRGYNNDEAIKMLETNKIVDAKSALDYFTKVENTHHLLSGRVDGVQYFRDGIATARNQRRLDMGLGKVLDSVFNPKTADTIDDIDKLGKDAWTALSNVGKQGELVSDNIDDIQKFRKSMTTRAKIGQAFGRTPQGQIILLGEDAIKTADTFRNTARQVLPRDLADFVTYKFINSEANDQVIVLRNLYYAIMQRYGLDGHPMGKQLIEDTLKAKFGDKEGLSIVSKLNVPTHLADDISKTGLKVEDNVIHYETSGIIHPFQEAGAVGSLDYITIAQTAWQIKSKKNLIMAAEGATQGKLAAEIVNAWSLLTLFPRLGIRSAIDEGMMFVLTAPAKEIFNFATRKGHRMGKVATAYTGSKSAEGVTAQLRKALGGTNPSDSIDIAQRLTAVSVAAKKYGISEDQVTKLQRSFVTGDWALELFGKNIDPKDADYLVQALAHSPMILNSATRSISGAASITGRFDREIVEQLVDVNNFDLMLRDLDVLTGRKGQLIETADLAKAKILGGRGVAAVHFENWIKRFYGNAKSLKGDKGKRLFDPTVNFLSNNALRTKDDFLKAREEALAAIGVRRNTDLISEIGEDGAEIVSKRYTYIIEDQAAAREFLQMSSRSSELRQRGISDAEAIVDQVDRILLDMYNAFHGDAGKFNATLFQRVKSAFDDLATKEKKDLEPITDKWHKAAQSVEFDEFENLTQGFQPIGKMYTTLQIEGITDVESALAKLGNQAFDIMDRQVTGLYRQPAVMLAYTRIRKNLAVLEKQEKKQAIARAVADLGDNAPKWRVNQAMEDAVEFVERKYVEIATRNAADTVLKYADNPNIRSNFAVSARNVGRFYRATEDFWRRTYRLKDVSVRVMYRMRLAHLGLDGAGGIYEDANGDPYVIMPMDNIIFKTVDSTVRNLTGNGAFQQPMFNDFTLKLKLANPSFSPDAGLPTLSGPISALGVLGMKSLLGSFGTTGKKVGEELDNLALGNIGEGMDIVRALVPSSVQKVYAALPFNEKSQQEATAAMQAIAYNASQGVMLDPNATEQEKYDYLKGIRISAHNIIAIRSILGLISPIAPSMQESIGVPEYLKEVGITGLRPEFYDLVNAVVKKYNGDVQDPYELAVATFVGKNPNKLIYTVARDQKETNVVIQKTKALKTWSIENQSLIDTYGEAAFILAPHAGEFDAGTYAWLEAADFISSKSLEKYYQDILVSRDKQAYYDIARREKEALSETASITERKAIINSATAERAYLKGSNPLLETALTAGGNEVASEIRMLTSLEQMLTSVNVNIPKEQRSKMIILTNQIRGFVDLAIDPVTRNAENFADIKRERKAEIENLISDMSDGDLMVKEANRAVFRAILDYYSRDTYVAFKKGF